MQANLACTSTTIIELVKNLVYLKKNKKQAFHERFSPLSTFLRSEKLRNGHVTFKNSQERLQNLLKSQQNQYLDEMWIYKHDFHYILDFCYPIVPGQFEENHLLIYFFYCNK
jgi:hypothetical protein